MQLSEWAALAAVTLLGSAVQAAFGFGFAILAAPLFLAVMNSTAAVPVLAVLNFAVSFVVALRLWRKAPQAVLLTMMAGASVGFPVGLKLFNLTDVRSLKVVVGVVIMVFAVLLLLRDKGWLPYLSHKTNDRPPSLAVAGGIGLVSGIMGAAIAMPGPVAMLYFASIALPKDGIRALSLSLFSYVYAAVSLLHWWNGGLEASKGLLALGLVPFVLAGSVLGARAVRGVSEARFRDWIYAILFVAGLFAVISI